jgi:site-specific DNA-methyltransferase (adenine-specific)
MSEVQIHHGKAELVVPTFEPETFHAVVTDPPYGLDTLNQADWDTQIAFDVDLWRATFETLKPGGWLVAFAHPRTYDCIAGAIRKAGFEIHDMLAWVYSSGFPRGKSVAPTIERAGGDPALAEDWKTTLKPALEPIVLARRPRKGTAGANFVKHGTGLLNIGANRIGDERRTNTAAGNKPGGKGAYNAARYGMPEGVESKDVVGRHPANFLVADDIADMHPALSSYFFVSKPSPAERKEARDHKTVKPVSLMEHLVSLVAAPGSHVLDLFAGSGSTGVAAVRVGADFTGIEMSKTDVTTIKRRTTAAKKARKG